MISDFQFNRIGVSLSGGPDSAILYYKVLKENLLLEMPKSIIALCMPKHDGADYFAKLVNDWMKVHFKLDELPLLFIGNPNDEHDQIVTNAIWSALKFNIVDCVLLADNVPPVNAFPGLQPVRNRSTIPSIVQPFFDLTKDQIISMFFEEGVEDLLAITHSCTEMTRGRCGRCWQCSERAWAFQTIGRVDPGSF